jgi:hypothetical protein
MTLLLLLVGINLFCLLRMVINSVLLCICFIVIAIYITLSLYRYALFCIYRFRNNQHSIAGATSVQPLTNSIAFAGVTGLRPTEQGTKGTTRVSGQTSDKDLKTAETHSHH